MNLPMPPCDRHPERPMAGDALFRDRRPWYVLRLCRECLDMIPEPKSRGWEDTYSDTYDTAPDGRLIHYKEPSFEWRKTK